MGVTIYINYEQKWWQQSFPRGGFGLNHLLLGPRSIWGNIMGNFCSLDPGHSCTIHAVYIFQKI